MSTKTVLQLDAMGYLIGPTVADESPLEPGVFLLPAGAVDANAPSIPEGFRAKWNGGGFDLESIPVDPEPEPPTLANRRAAVWEQIKAKREALKSGGVKVGAHWFHSDADSRIQQLGLVIMGANMPAGLKWKTMDNGLVDMTPTLAQQIFATTANWDATVFGVAEVHRAAVMASDNPEAYDWSAGWPAGYTGQVNE